MKNYSLLRNGSCGKRVISKSGNNGSRMDVFAFLPEWQQRLVSEQSILSAPMRHVRAARRNGDSFHPKSRLRIPGHFVSTYWNRQWQIPGTIAVSLNTSSETFDVSCGLPVRQADRWVVSHLRPVVWPAVSWSMFQKYPQAASPDTEGHIWVNGGTKVVVPTSSRASDRPSGFNKPKVVLVKRDAGGKLK